MYGLKINERKKSTLDTGVLYELQATFYKLPVTMNKYFWIDRKILPSSMMGSRFSGNTARRYAVTFISKLYRFLVACTRLYKTLCRSVRPSVGLFTSNFRSHISLFRGLQSCITAPAQPHATDVAVYPALFFLSLLFPPPRVTSGIRQ